MGKLLLAFLFCSTSAGIAVREAVRAPMHVVTMPSAPIELPPRDRVNVDETADRARFARPFIVRSPPPPTPPIIETPPVVETLEDVELPNPDDACHERDVHEIDGELGDDDGCPQPLRVHEPRTVIRLDVID